MRAFVVAGLAGAGAVLLPGLAQAASFNCNRASTPDEFAICGDPQLSRLDDQIALAFAGAKRAAGTDVALQVAHAFMAQRAQCGPNRRCIRAAMLGALDQYRTLAQGGSYGSDDNDGTTDAGGNGSTDAVPVTPDDADGAPRATGGLPTRIGQCAMTAVKEVGPRLGEEGRQPQPEDYDSGTGVSFTNGGYQVSYENERGLRASRPGDPVRMCLVELPRDCPPGDDRGKVYRSTDLRTHQTWTLPDSEHSCGGA